MIVILKVVQFILTATICTTGRSAAQIRQQGVGTDLYIQNGTDITHSIKIPHKETGIPSTNWTRGKCFPSMGKLVFLLSLCPLVDNFHFLSID